MNRWSFISVLALLASNNAEAFSPLFQSPARFQKHNKMRVGAVTIKINNSAATTSLGSTATVTSPPSDASKSSNGNKNKLQSFVSSRLFSCVVTFLVGLRIGLKSTATSAGVRGGVRQVPVASFLLAAFAVREVYRAIPEWARDGSRRKKKKIADGSMDEDDMSSLASISFKLQSLFDVASEKLASGMPPGNMRASLYATFQLFGQVKEQQAQERDDAYQQAGRLVEDPHTVLQNMDTMFEFADWAYDEYPEEEEEATCLEERLETQGYVLLRHDKTALPGRVAHYIAISQEEQTVLIGVKGTSNFEDLLTDCCGRSKNHTLDSPFMKYGPTEICVHEGIFISAQKLARDLEAFVNYVAIPNGYKIVITGHSLGAGAAAIAGLLLRSKFSKLRQDSRLHVFAFASPPVLDKESALACKSFTTTIVNNADLIPRSSLHNLGILLKFMEILNEKLEQQGKLPDNFKNLSAFMKFISEGKDGEMIMTAQETKNAMKECIAKLNESDPDFLYVPGRVIHMFDLWSKTNYGETEQRVEQRANETTIDSEIDTVKTAEQVYEGDGTSDVLKIIEIDERMVPDHLSMGYRDSIRSLLSSPAS
jgi:hypothetical protein